MTKELINELVLKGQFPQSCGLPELIETHISWVVICDRFVYKIKKPIQYSFLDFSSLEKRKYYCEREVELNKRLTDDIYLDVQPVRKTSCGLFIGGEDGEVIDYAVRMRRLERDRQMDILLLNNKVTTSDIQNLAEKIAAFHKNTTIIYEKNFLGIQKKFNDLEEEIPYLQEYLNANSSIIIRHALVTSDRFIERNKDLLATRLKAGFFRDCHGDLHSRNIFLLPSPQPFDCIEFNDDYRQTDVLNDVAFLCMDLDAFNRKDLSDLFLNCYNNLFPSIKTDDDRRLFIYYKSYRANIRAKVNSLRARYAKDDVQRISALAEADKYLNLMDGYLKMLEAEF
jgi:aminoglycoside phosphotransferase family enzyme